MYIHTYTHPSIHTYIYIIYMLAYIHIYIHTGIHTYIDSQTGIPVSQDTGKDAQTSILVSWVHRVKVSNDFFLHYYYTV